MDELRKVHIRVGWILTLAGIALIIVNAMNTTSLLCLGLGIALLVYAKMDLRKEPQGQQREAD